MLVALKHTVMQEVMAKPAKKWTLLPIPEIAKCTTLQGHTANPMKKWMLLPMIED